MGMPIEELMLIRYSCKDMGLNCSFILKGETIEDVTHKALEHIQEKHADDFNAITSPKQIEDMYKILERSTREVPA
jgi:predicted small metal-binding protein